MTHQSPNYSSIRKQLYQELWFQEVLGHTDTTYCDTTISSACMTWIPPFMRKHSSIMPEATRASTVVHYFHHPLRKILSCVVPDRAVNPKTGRSAQHCSYGLGLPEVSMRLPLMTRGSLPLTYNTNNEKRFVSEYKYRLFFRNRESSCLSGRVCRSATTMRKGSFR